MDDFSQMLELVAQQLKGSDSALRVERAYPAKLRGNPQCEKLAVIGIQKVKLEPVGLQNFYGGQTLPLGRQATVWVKVSFCCKSGGDCWKLWESCAQGMLCRQRRGQTVKDTVCQAQQALFRQTQHARGGDHFGNGSGPENRRGRDHTLGRGF